MSRSPRQGAPAKKLTTREKDVLRLVAKGCSNKEIGEHLYISEYTVKNHLSNILAKLHLNNRVQLVAYAAQEGMLPPED